MPPSFFIKTASMTLRIRKKPGYKPSFPFLCHYIFNPYYMVLSWASKHNGTTCTLYMMHVSTICKQFLGVNLLVLVVERAESAGLSWWTSTFNYSCREVYTLTLCIFALSAHLETLTGNVFMCFIILYTLLVKSW
jgi:hypothetical protein